MDKSFLDKEIQYVKGVGPERARLFAKLGITNLTSLLYYFPREWVDRSNIKTIIEVKPGNLETVSGFVVSAETKQVRGALKITSVTIKDKTGFITGTWFNQPFMEKQFKRGLAVIFHGKVEFYRGMLQISNPEYEIAEDEDGETAEPINVNRIVPIYPLTEKLSQKQFRKIIKFTLDNYLSYLSEYMPNEVKERYNLIELQTAVYNSHYPTDFKMLEEAKRRIIFDEFFFMQLAFAMRKKKVKDEPGIVFADNGKLFTQFISTLPFALTNAQKRVLDEIKKDFTSGKPMNRLVQGDVGSGKTIIAIAAAVIAVDNGYQAAIMAPTELLADQHMRNITAFLNGTGIKTTLLLGGLKKKLREEVLNDIKNGTVNIIIGTHALIQDDVIYNKLGLAVIDEQHRFGVMQRAQLMRKGTSLPHSLIMTAT
ncbi:MAG: DEAD/DEAH box helicase, partial [bacterium]